jgi:hypothetical protein
MYSQLNKPSVELETPQQAMNMAQLARQAQLQNQDFQDQQAMRQAFAKNVITDENGKPQVNRPGVLSDMMRANPQKAMELEQHFKDMDLNEMNRQTQIAKELSWSATPENWSQTRQKWSQMGLQNADQLPEQYDQKFVDNVKMHTLRGEEQLKAKFEQQRLDLERQAKVGDKVDKYSKQLDDHLDKGWTARGGVAAGNTQQTLNAAEKAEGLIAQGRGQTGGLDSRQIEELATSVQKLLSPGGSSASGRIEALVPHTFWGKAQSLREYLTNNPTGLNQGAFADRLAETVAREKAIADDQKKKFQIEGLPAHNKLKQMAPDQYNAILRAKGIDPDTMIDANGRYKSQSSTAPAAHPQDDAAVSWAKQNMNDPRAAQILKLNGGG